MKYEKSCGAILFCNFNGLIKWLIIRHLPEHGNHWDFPKGHMESGESELDTARREVFEECGLTFNLIEGFCELMTFNPTPDISKDVVIFLGETKSNLVHLEVDELADYKWLEYDDALNLLTFDRAKTILKNAKEFISN